MGRIGVSVRVSSLAYLGLIAEIHLPEQGFPARFLGQVGGQVVGEPAVSRPEGRGLRALRFRHGPEPVVVGVEHRGGVKLPGWEGLTW